MLKCVTGNVNLMQSFPMNHNVLTQCQRRVSESVIWDLMCLPITFEASLIILLSGTLTITSLLILTILPLSKYTSPFSHSDIMETCAGDEYLASYFRGSIQSFLHNTKSPFHVTERLFNRITGCRDFPVESERNYKFSM